MDESQCRGSVLGAELEASCEGEYLTSWEWQYSLDAETKKEIATPTSGAILALPELGTERFPFLLLEEST